MHPWRLYLHCGFQMLLEVLSPKLQEIALMKEGSTFSDRLTSFCVLKISTNRVRQTGTKFAKRFLKKSSPGIHTY